MQPRARRDGSFAITAAVEAAIRASGSPSPFFARISTCRAAELPAKHPARRVPSSPPPVTPVSARWTSRLADVAVAALTSSKARQQGLLADRPRGPDVCRHGAQLSKAVGRIDHVSSICRPNPCGRHSRPGYPGLAGGRTARRVRDVPSWRGGGRRTRRARSLGPLPVPFTSSRVTTPGVRVRR